MEQFGESELNSAPFCPVDPVVSEIKHVRGQVRFTAPLPGVKPK